MARLNLAKLSYKQLRDLELKIKAAIGRRRTEEKVELKRKLAQMAADSGFDIQELIDKRSARKGSTARPKYRHPKDASLTWTGRGRQPLWLAAEIKKGRKLEGFLIK